MNFGLVDFADILYTWSNELYGFWVYVNTTSAHDFLVDIEGKFLLTIIGTPVSFVISAYINLTNLFNDNYLANSSLLDWMLGGLLKLFVGITVAIWLHKLYQTVMPGAVE